KAGGGVARIRLVFVRRADGVVEILSLLLVDFFASAFKLFEFHFNQGASGGIATHDSVACRRPGKDESWIVRLAAHRVMTGTEASTTNDADFRHHTIRYCIYHFCAGSNDPAPLGVFADHKAVDVV